MDGVRSTVRMQTLGRSRPCVFAFARLYTLGGDMYHDEEEVMFEAERSDKRGEKGYKRVKREKKKHGNVRRKMMEEMKKKKDVKTMSERDIRR